MYTREYIHIFIYVCAGIYICMYIYIYNYMMTIYSMHAEFYKLVMRHSKSNPLASDEPDLRYFHVSILIFSYRVNLGLTPRILCIRSRPSRRRSKFIYIYICVCVCVCVWIPGARLVARLLFQRVNPTSLAPGIHIYTYICIYKHKYIRRQLGRDRTQRVRKACFEAQSRWTLACSVAYYIACYNAIQPPSDATVLYSIALLFSDIWTISSGPDYCCCCWLLAHAPAGPQNAKN